MKRLFTTIALAACLTLSMQVSSQCAMCRMNAESATENVDEGIGRGLNDGIMYLMGIPYLLLGIGAVTFYRRGNKTADQG